MCQLLLQGQLGTVSDAGSAILTLNTAVVFAYYFKCKSRHCLPGPHDIWGTSSHQETPSSDCAWLKANHQQTFTATFDQFKVHDWQDFFMSHLLYRIEMTLFKPRCVSISLLHVLSTQALGSRILCPSERKYDLHSNRATNATNDKAQQQELWTLTQSI